MEIGKKNTSQQTEGRTRFSYCALPTQDHIECERSCVFKPFVISLRYQRIRGDGQRGWHTHVAWGICFTASDHIKTVDGAGKSVGVYVKKAVVDLGVDGIMYGLYSLVVLVLSRNRMQCP
jgi:hypothetical protein